MRHLKAKVSKGIFSSAESFSSHPALWMSSQVLVAAQRIWHEQKEVQGLGKPRRKKG